ncbi:helix-turn-helix transcriptional regulator [Nocardioides sp.]|uniref:helix-turn-helix domain-containing protein n=1 Tax=Nocardioides sp. TaxID=35761 RepID=UPI0031FF0D9D
MVNQKPERVALQVIAAICDIFSCGPEDLITANSPRDSRRATPSAVAPARAAPSAAVAAAATPARPGRAGRTARSAVPASPWRPAPTAPARLREPPAAPRAARS